MPTPPAAPPRPHRPPVLRLTNPDDVFAAIPYLLGFHPEKSLVVLGLSGPRSRLGVSMRMDLDSGPPDRLADVVRGALQRDRAEEAIVVLYGPTEGPRGQPGDELVTTLRAVLSAAHIRVRDAYRVSDGRWWSYLCDDPTCCPTEGAPIRRPDQAGGPSRVAATAVVAGLAAFPDRGALRASLEAPAPWTRPAAEQALERLGEQLAVRFDRGEKDQVAGEMLASIAELRTRFAGRQPSLSTDEAATVAVALHSIRLRDEVVTWTADHDADALQRLLTEVVRSVGPPEHVPAVTVLAWGAYLSGNGALASVALESALVADPDYSLAQLLDRLVQSGIHPDELRRQTELTRADLRQSSGRPGPGVPPSRFDLR